MAINTPKPISRDERYLSKIGGNEKVIVPKPISREEKYMYRAAGYDDQPIPDYPISRKEKYWAKIIENGGGSGIGSTVTFDSGQKFISDNSSLKDYKIYGNGGEIRSTGVLPLTFTAKGGTAADWVIYGNDENGTENLFDKNDISELNAYINTNGVVTSSSVNRTLIISVEPSTTYTIKMSRIPITSTDNARLALYSTQPEISSSGTVVGFVSAGSNINITFTSGVNDYYLGFKFCNVETSSYQDQLDTIMLVKGSTAPDHYIPYQKGVGERTENLLDVTIAEFEDNSYINGYGNIASTTAAYSATVGYIPVEPNTTYTIKHYLPNGSGTRFALYDDTKTFIKASSNTATTMTFTTDATAAYARFSVATADKNNVMLVKGSTAPDHYIPYGYKVPLTVSQQGQPDKTVDIYIGDSPLTEGETVTKTSTGVDIELFEGENTVSTTLYNKPAMEIEASYGVGVKDNNHYIIPFKVNTTIYNIQIGDSPLYDGEYLSYKEKKLYKYIDSVLTPIDPPSPFPEISTTEGVNKVIIETSTQPNSIFITTQNPIKLVQPNIGTKTITQNGVYNASDDNLDGYSSVTVNTN